MKKIFLFLLFSFNLFVINSQADFPTKPVKIVVYTAPGGLIDVSSRKLAKIIKEQDFPKPIIIENKKGAGGLIALNHVIKQKSDGHTIFALTSSVISKVVGAGKESLFSELKFLGRIVKDYECVITNKKSNLDTIEKVIDQAKEKPGKQIWLGPAAGGTDHIFAKKVWNATNIQAKWVPYKSGGEAIAALLGNHGDVYVGNQQDVIGRPDLQVIAIASPDSVKYPNNFLNAGFTDLKSEVLWRGFAVKKGTSEETLKYLEKTIKLAIESEEWKKFISQGQMEGIFETGESFENAVKAQIETDKKYL